MKEQLTIIVPVYNEEEALPHLRRSLDEYLEITPVKSTILFVNDGSTDNSLEIIKSVCGEDHRYTFISLNKNQGLSSALKYAIDLIETPYTGYIDADLQTTPKDFIQFFKHMNNCNMVNGIRANRYDKLIKRISSSIANGFRQMVLHDGIKDTCCPLKLIETKWAKKIPFFQGMHRFMPALVQMPGGKVKQIEISHFPRIAGKPKYHLYNRMLGPLLDTFAVLWMKKNWISTDHPQEEVSLKSGSAINKTVP